MNGSGNIVLVGFMGTGKSEVGQILAVGLGKTFVDTDAMIEAQTGQTIPNLFKEKGEPGFRAIEKEVVLSLSELTEHVVATGGGAVVDPENMAALRSLGPVVHLSADPEVILSRTDGDAGARPMLTGHDALQRIKDLLDARAPFYGDADITVDTSTVDTFDVARQVIQRVDNVSRTIHVDLDEKSYDIIIGDSILPRFGLMLRQFNLTSRALVVTNPKLRELYGNVIEISLRSAGFEPEIAEVPDGEAYKTLESASKLYDAMLGHRMDRQSPVVALGGGVIGDLAGHAAATFMRGVPFIQAPTSLLAQVDASVGGKVAVDHPRGKNLIGAFYQPKLVLISLDTLDTLSDRELRAGMAEVIKYGVIHDVELFAYLEKNMDAILKRDEEMLTHLVARSCEIKAEVVSGDEREEGRRAILNFGHTMGHAIELHTGVLHGEAIAAGMVYAAQIAQKMGMFDESSVARLIELVERTDLPTCYAGLDRDQILETMKYDKKTVGGQFRFVLPTCLGDVTVRGDVPTELINSVLRD
ncbi:MAG: 3-dehydroquinate synthase [Gemmatimonadota bacterium]|nr:3-dehydroquinate synthase [Gemmatimonadota bacterium]